MDVPLAFMDSLLCEPRVLIEANSLCNSTWIMICGLDFALDI